MSDRRIAVLFYGLFMDIEILRSEGLNPHEPAMAAVPGFALRIGERATLVADHPSTAFGMVMRLTHDEVEKLYSEASVRMYRPEAVAVRLQLPADYVSAMH